jgi:hypothetical protein
MSEYSDLQRTMADTAERMPALEAVTRPGFTIAKGIRLVQENAPETIWVEELKFQSQLVPIDPKDSRKGRVLNELVSVSGQVMSRETSARASLEELTRTIERVGDGATAQLRVVGVARTGGADTRFTLDVKVIGDGKTKPDSGEQL